MSLVKRFMAFAPVKKAMYLHCGESARLITARLDGPLPFWSRLRLWRHLLFCTACPKFVLQMQVMERAMGRWRSYVEQPGDE